MSQEEVEKVIRDYNDCNAPVCVICNGLASTLTRLPRRMGEEEKYREVLEEIVSHENDLGMMYDGQIPASGYAEMLNNLYAIAKQALGSGGK